MWYWLESEHLPGVDVILDNIGGPYLQRNLNSLGVDGRLFIIGFQGGAVTEVNLQAVLARRLTIQGILVAQARGNNIIHYISVMLSKNFYVSLLMFFRV